MDKVTAKFQKKDCPKITFSTEHQGEDKANGNLPPTASNHYLNHLAAASNPPLEHLQQQAIHTPQFTDIRMRLQAKYS